MSQDGTGCPCQNILECSAWFGFSGWSLGLPACFGRAFEVDVIQYTSTGATMQNGVSHIVTNISEFASSFSDSYAYPGGTYGGCALSLFFNKHASHSGYFKFRVGSQRLGNWNVQVITDFVAIPQTPYWNSQYSSYTSLICFPGAPSTSNFFFFFFFRLVYSMSN